MKNTALTVALFAFASSLPVLSQKLEPNQLATNLADTVSIAAPAQGFNPLTASDEELAYSGFPPRPDQGSSPELFATWTKAVSTAKVRIVPSLRRSTKFSGPAKISKTASPATGSAGVTFYSSNWSGYANTSGTSTYGRGSFGYVESIFQVPTAGMPVGVCDPNWEYSVSWVGIDGLGSPDVLQAGFEDDAYCSGGATFTYYAPWFEWYPNPWTNINNLSISPGDELFVAVWSTSSTQGNTYIVDETTEQAVSISFSAPSGTTLQGNTAEWIVERPGIGGSLATMANYGDDVFWGAGATTFRNEQQDPGSRTSLGIICLDNYDNPISYPTLLGPSAFVMQTEGSAH